MKTFVKSLAKALSMLALVPAIPYAASAQTTVSAHYRPFEAAIYPAATPLKLWINVQKNEHTTSPLRVELIDKKNHVLYASELPRRGRSFKQRFDMSELGDGTYTLRITDGNELVEKTFRLSTPGLREQLPSRLVSMSN